MEIVPLRPNANQTLQCVLGGQNCTITLQTREIYGGVGQGSWTAIYASLHIDDAPVFMGSICLDGVPLKRYRHLPFSGDLVFVDMHGAEDPRPDGLGDRWRLVYLTEDEMERYERGEAI